MTKLHLHAAGRKKFNSLTSRGKGFSFRHSIPTDLADHPDSYPVNAEGSRWGVDRSYREDDHTYLSAAELRLVGGIPPFPICRNFLCLIKRRAKYTCTFRNSAVSKKEVPSGGIFAPGFGSACVMA